MYTRDNASIAASSRYYCVPFLTNGQRIGLLRPDVLVFLKNYSQGNEEALNIVYHEGEVIRVELNCDTVSLTLYINPLY